MARKLRLEYPGAMYHIMSRGDQREDIFLDEVDRHDWLAYPWSSFILYLAAREHRPRWLRAERLLGEHGIPQDTPASRQEFERHMQRRRLEEVDEEALKEFRQAWAIGGEAFRQECLEQIEGQLGENHPGQTRLESAQAKADRILEEELARLHWTANDLQTRPKSDPTKLALAARLRQETTLSVKEIAERMHLGKPKGARSNLHKFMNSSPTQTAQFQLNIQ